MKYFLLLVVCVILLVGCVAPTSGENSRYLPSGSTNLASEGNGWVSFKWQGQCFLMNETGVLFANNYDRVLTKIDCKD